MLLRDTILIGPAPTPLGNTAAPHLKTALPLGEAADVSSASHTDTLVESVADIKLSATPAPSLPMSAASTRVSVDGVSSVGKESIEVQTDKESAAFWKIAADHLVPLKAPWLDFVPVRAEGTVLYDKDGREMLDFTSGQMSSLVGHCHPEITAVIQREAPRLDHLFSSMLSQPIADLAAGLASLLPESLSKYIFLSTGSETAECSIKMAKLYTGKWEIVGFSTGYHGMSAGSSSATFVSGRAGFGPLIPGNFLLPVPDASHSPFNRDGVYDWRAEMAFGWELIDRQSTGNLAACIVEPIVSTGGMVELPEGYLEELKAQCEKRGMLLICDEAQTAMGRTGDMFAYQHSTITPDILLLSKTLGAGLPLAAVCTSPAISARLAELGYMYYTTHLNDPLVCAVGAKVCEIVKREDVCGIARSKGAIFKAGLSKLKEKYAFISQVRGRGLMLGLHLISPDVGAALSAKAFELGLNCNLVPLRELGGTIRIVPPLTVTEAELKKGLEILDEACKWVEMEMAA